MTGQLREIIFEHRAQDDVRARPFRRQKFFAMSAASFFGLAGKLAFPGVAEADHNPSDCPAPRGDTTPCVGRRICDCCVWGPGCTCCSGLCSPSNPDPSGQVGCPYDNSCWITCYQNRTWKCCDFIQCGHQCICRLYLGDYCNW